MSGWKSIIAEHSGYPQPEGDFTWFFSVYDISNGCSTCGIGKIQKSPFKVKGFPAKKQNHFFCLNWVNDELFISNEIKECFEAEQITGIKFIHPIGYVTGFEITDYWQIIISDCIDRKVENNNLIEEKCEMPKDSKQVKFLKANKSRLVEGPFCGSIKYNFPQTEGFIYKKEAFSDCNDFMKSNEWFGSGGSSSKATFISDKVYRIISKNKFKGMHFTEVILI